MFVDRIIEHLKNHVVQPTLVRVADIHSRALSDRFESFKFIDLGRVVLLTLPDVGTLVLTFSGV